MRLRADFAKKLRSDGTRSFKQKGEVPPRSASSGLSRVVQERIHSPSPKVQETPKVVEPPVNQPVSPALTGRVLSHSEKVKELEDLKSAALTCLKCEHLVSFRKQVVFGVGNPDAKIMFIGEAPGADEDEQGEPFVGAAGQLLTKMIKAMGIEREDVYIANVLKCRPDVMSGAYGNRKPKQDEMKTCLPYLGAQISIIRPSVMVGLGATAMEGLSGKTKIGITRLRGQWQDFRGIPVMPTFHPSYLLRNRSMAERRKVWEDLLAVMEKVQMSVSEKQRGYFLK